MSAGESVGELIDAPDSDDLEGASNVLVLATSLDEGIRESYYRTLLPAQPSAMDVLAVDYRRTPDQILEEWHRYAGEKPRQCGIICVGESTRGPEDTSDIGNGAVACVENPTDLTGIGIKVGNYLEGYGGPETVLTFDSLTVLLQYVELQRAFRFLHVLSNQVRSVDAVAHYHIDPAAHDDQVLATLASIFDAIARFDDGDWEIRTR